MNGKALLDEIRNRICKDRGTKSVTDAVLAKELGVSVPSLIAWRKAEFTPRQVVNLMEKRAVAAQAHTMAGAVEPIVEFFFIESAESRGGANWHLLSATDEDGERHHYLGGLRERLEANHGIYIFYDSRGRAIYAGKAQRQSLWTEMTNAYNRDRGAKQSLRRVDHPSKKVEYRGHDEQRRQIKSRAVPLHEIAAYMSAYKVPDGLIGKFEALIVRAFANDLLNKKMENF